MFKHNSKKKRAFYVVQFIELPFKGIDDYVCVPSTWLIVRRAMNQKAVVAYPQDEDPFETRDRVKRKERCNDEWRFYMAVVKYESDTYRDAEFWIASRNNCGSLVEEESKITDTLPRVTLNKKLRSANQSHSSKSNDNPRKPLPKISIKRPALSEPKKQLDRKRLKLSEGAQSSSAVIDDSNAEPGHSRKQQSIINQENHSMECALTKGARAATNGNESTEQRTQTQPAEQNEQPLSLPAINVDEPTEVINIDDEDHSQGFKNVDKNNSISQSHLASNMAAASITAMEPSTSAEQTTQSNQDINLEHILDSGSSLSNFQPRIENVRSIANVHNNHELRVNGVSNNDLSTTFETPSSLKMSDNIYSHMNGARRLEPIQRPIDNRIRLMNMEKNLAITTQNLSNFMDQTGSLSTPLVKQPSAVIQNQSQDDPQARKMHIGNSRDQTVLRSSIASSSQEIQHVPRINIERSQDVITVDPRNVFQSTTNIASASQNLTSSFYQQHSFVRQLDKQQSSSPQEQYLTHSYQNQYLPPNRNSFNQELLRGSHRNQQDSQQQPQRPKISIGIAVKPKNNRQMPTRQGVTKNTSPPIITKVLNSIREALSTNHNNYLLNEQQLQANQSESVLVPESHLNVVDNACQTDCMGEEAPSPYHEVTSDSDAVTDHEVISDHDMPGIKAPVEIVNNSYYSGIASRSNSADRPPAAQNFTSTNHPTDPRIVLEQQMLDSFASLLTQMGSTLRYTCDMYNNLRESIHETAETYRCLLDAVDKFNTAQNSASNAFPSSNLPPQVPPTTQERHIEATANSSNKDRQSHDLGNKAPKNKSNDLWRFVLPPEYDPQDTRWTLKYQTNMPGLVELRPQSGIYVGYGELKYCQQVSKDCKSLARRLLLEVFNREALSVCLSISEKAQASNNVGSNVRPRLDDHATSVLLNFILKYGLQCGWNTDLKPIISTLNSKIQEIRSKYGVMVKC